MFIVIIAPYVKYWEHVFALNATFMDDILSRSDACNYTFYMDTYLTFPPPPGHFPKPPSFTAPGCDIFDDVNSFPHQPLYQTKQMQVYYAAMEINPCFDVYHITDTCPFAYNPLGNVAFGYEPPGATVYFNRSDVQAAIHAPPTNWSECNLNNVFPGPDGTNPGDLSLPSSQSGVLQSVIERTNNVIIASGGLDFLVPANGTLMIVQNMTWNGQQGFQKDPRTTEFYVPYHPEYSQGALAGAGIVGTFGTERGLTFAVVDLAGHSGCAEVEFRSFADGWQVYPSMLPVRHIGWWKSCSGELSH